jgi:glycosyltransferase involved in cell wall biosynthesis
MHTLYLCYFGLREPLVQTQVLPYLRELVKGNVAVSLLTFEPNWRKGWSDDERIKWRETLAAEGIRWRARAYHKRPSLPATLYDVCVGVGFAAWQVWRGDVQVLHARGHVPAMMGAITKRLAGGRLVFDIRGFMPEEYVDGGVWPAGGRLYRRVKAAERWLLNQADGFVVLTEKAREILFPGCGEQDEQGRPIEVIPCCVDGDRFRAAEKYDRETVRHELGLNGRRVIVYVGALGGWYLTDELTDFLATASKADAATYALILTQSPAEVITGKLVSRGLKKQDFMVQHVPPAEIPKYLKAADIAISFIKPCYSKLSSSPTKIAEYLASGLPVISNAGIGDLDEMIEADHVGVIIRELNHSGYKQALAQATALLNEPGIADRCRQTALRRFDLKQVGGMRYRRLYQRLIKGSTAIPHVSTPQQAALLSDAEPSVE